MDVPASEKRLAEERREILEMLERLRKELQSEVEFDAEEYNPELFEREKVLYTIQMLEHQLAQIEDAMRRLETGQYGICQDCGNPIEPARLEAMPEAIYCLACKSKRERSL